MITMQDQPLTKSFLFFLFLPLLSIAYEYQLLHQLYLQLSFLDLMMHMDLGNIICISFLKITISLGELLVNIFPLYIISPDVGSYSFNIVLPVVVLPQPDSPTRPKVSPLFI